MTERTTCAIIGGGPAGMVLGLLLARAGVKVTVLEKHADFLRDFRGDTVHPSTLELLEDLGLYERFSRLPQSRLDRAVFPLDADRTVTVADFRRLRSPHPYIAMVPQWDLLNLFAEAGEWEPTFTLRMSTEAIGLLRGPDGVTGVRYRDLEGEGEIHAELTVACDGRWSLAREEAALVTREFPVGIDAWWFRLPSGSVHRTALTPRAGLGRFTVVIPREGYLQVAYIGRKGTDAALRARGVEAFRRDLVELMPELTDQIASLRSMDEVKHLDVRLNRLRRWHVDGLLCIGDAAHAMSPVGGVGINLAVQDAVATAALLGPALRDRSLRPRDLAAVRRRRIVPTVAVQTLQRLMHRLLAEPMVRGERPGLPGPVVTLLERAPWLSFVPAYLIGKGVRPERAPAFARRRSGPRGRGAPSR